MSPLEDASDARLAPFRTDAATRAALRADGRLVAESRRLVRALLRDPTAPVEALLLTPAAHRALADVLPDGDRVLTISPPALDALLGFRLHQGALALARRPTATPLRDLLARAAPGRPLLILEAVRDPDNVGSLFRNGLALGAAGVVLTDGCADPFDRKALRVSTGAALRLPYAHGGAPGAVIAALAPPLVRIALTPHDADPLDEVARALADRPLALVLGTEGDGLSPSTLAACDVRARIPVDPRAESLNVATAAAIALARLAQP